MIGKPYPKEKYDKIKKFIKPNRRKLMAKYYTEEERSQLWLGIRQVLVDQNFMLPNGEPTPNNEKICKDMRKLILIDITTKG